MNFLDLSFLDFYPEEEHLLNLSKKLFERGYILRSISFGTLKDINIVKSLEKVFVESSYDKEIFYVPYKDLDFSFLPKKELKIVRSFLLDKNLKDKILLNKNVYVEDKTYSFDIFYEESFDEDSIKDFIYAREYLDLKEIFHAELLKRNITFATAESCTGGLLSSMVVDNPGSSSYFIGGFVVYSNFLKKEVLKVREETLKSFGAVSENTVRQMLYGLYDITKADLLIAISGIAGPSSDNSLKPVGLTYIGIKYLEKVFVFEEIFNENRNQNRKLSSNYAMFKALKIIKGEI